jgi:hypothetical protein
MKCLKWVYFCVSVWAGGDQASRGAGERCPWVCSREGQPEAHAGVWAMKATWCSVPSHHPPQPPTTKALAGARFYTQESKDCTSTPPSPQWFCHYNATTLLFHPPPTSTVPHNLQLYDEGQLHCSKLLKRLLLGLICICCWTVYTLWKKLIKNQIRKCVKYKAM